MFVRLLTGSSSNSLGCISKALDLTISRFMYSCPVENWDWFMPGTQIPHNHHWHGDNQKVCLKGMHVCAHVVYMQVSCMYKCHCSICMSCVCIPCVCNGNVFACACAGTMCCMVYGVCCVCTCVYHMRAHVICGCMCHIASCCV